MIIDPYQWHTVRITHIDHPAPDAVIITTEKPTHYTFAPGQHAVVRVRLSDGTQRIRQYSFSDSPTISQLQFTITRSPRGDVSSWFIDQCSLASTIDLSQPFTGPLAIDPSSYRQIGMIAGGSGIAPIMSHLSVMRESQNTAKRILLYTTRSQSHCVTDRLSPIASEVIITRLSDIDGRLTSLEIIDNLAGCDLILLCGSRQFVSALHDICSKTLPRSEIRAEAFSLQ